MFTAALFIIASTEKQSRCPLTDEWLKKLWYTYTMEYYLAIKRTVFESILMRWMRPEPTIQSEVSQKEKHQYNILTYILYMLYIYNIYIYIMASRPCRRRRSSSPRGQGSLGVVRERRPQCAVSHEVRRRGQWASRGAPGKSGLHASGEGERVIAPEPW